MQILPTSISSDSSLDELSSAGNSGRDSFGFSQIFSDHFNSTPAEVTPNVDTVSYENYDSSSNLDDMFATEDPYEDIGQSRVDVSRLETTIPLDQVRFTDAELKQMIHALEGKGTDANALKSLLGSINGVGVHDVIEALAQSKPVKLTESNMMHIQNLALKFDGSGEFGKSLLTDVRQGNSLQAWNRFTEALNAQGSEKVFSINKAEMASFSKALGVDQSVIESIYKSFGDKNELSLTADGLKQLTVPLQQEMANKIDEQSKLASQLEGVLKPIISEARKRMELEAAAGSHAAKKVQHSEILIRDTVMQKGMNSALGVQQDKEKISVVTNQPDNNKVVGKEAHNQSIDQAKVTQAGNGNNAQQFKDSNDFSDKQQKDKKDVFGDSIFTHAHSDKHLISNEESKNPWNLLAQRLELQLPIDTGISGQLMNQQQAQQPVGWDRLTSKMLSQVEQGAFSSLHNGTSRLELQVNTAELGTVNILLTTKNGEISALLRPERKDVADILMDRLEGLRLELEEKGLKVDKVDVQTQLNDGQNMHWNGTEQHNSFQQQQARARDLERLRMLGKVRQESSPIEISLAHNMQNKSITAGNSNRLNIIA